MRIIFRPRALAGDLSPLLLLSTAPGLAAHRPMPLRDNSRTRKMLHKLLQTSSRFSDASDSAKYARHAHTMRIIDLLAHILAHIYFGAYVVTAMRKERLCSPRWPWEREAERCSCNRCQAAQAWALLRKFCPGRTVHVGRLTSLPLNRLTATRRGARVVRRTRAPLRTFLPKSVCADFQECPASRG